MSQNYRESSSANCAPPSRACLPAFLETLRGGGQARNAKPTPLDGKKVFVFCEPDHPFAKKARAKTPEALWVAAVLGNYALAWRPDKFLLWHEALHLLWAHDCYDRVTKTRMSNCDESRCIMQYVACAENCGGDLYLCSANVESVTMEGM